MTDVVDTNDLRPEEEPTGRRRLLGKAAIAAAVAAVAGVGGSKSAQAANGSSMIIGHPALSPNSASLTTTLLGGGTFYVQNGSSFGITGGKNPRNGSIYARSTITNTAGVLGEAIGAGGWGVYGRNNGALQGIGVYGLNYDGSGGYGVYGEHNTTSTISGTGVIGVSNNGSGVTGTTSVGAGVIGVSDNGNGVTGTTSVGTAMVATSSNGDGLAASGTIYDIVANGKGNVVLNKVGVASPPAGASAIGLLARDAEGNLWYSPASGQYRKLAGTGTAGAYHAISPGRVYDSRAALPSPGVLANATGRLVSVADKRDADGAVVTAGFIPAGATSVTCNVTVVNTVNAGFLTILPGGTPFDIATATAAINWSGTGQILNNGVTLTLNAARELSVYAGGGGNTDFVIDVTGYFL